MKPTGKPYYNMENMKKQQESKAWEDVPMISLEINNSHSRIKGLNVDQFKKLRKELSYTSDPSAAYHSGGFVRVKYLLDKYGNFPTGLVNKVLKHAVKHGYTPSISDLRKPPTCLRTPYRPIFDHTPYPDQIDAVNKAVQAHRGGIVMPTGTGKSLVIGMLIARLNVRTLIVVPTVEIKKQLQKDISDWFTFVGNITVENIDSPALKTLTNFDCLIIDECHHAAAKTYQTLNKTAWSGIYYRFFLSATFFRNQTNEQLLFEGVAGEVVYRLTYKTAIEKGYIVPVEAYYIDLPKQAHYNGFTWREVYSDLVVNNSERNERIAKLLRSLEKAEKSTLCLVKEIAHGNNIGNHWSGSFVNGQDEESRVAISAFNERIEHTLVGTEGILGEGVDTKPCEYVIIAGLGKAKSSFMQKVGRAVRRYPGKETAKIILFRDTSHKFTLRHYNAQKKILLDEYGVKPIKLDL